MNDRLRVGFGEFAFRDQPLRQFFQDLVRSDEVHFEQAFFVESGAHAMREEGGKQNVGVEDGSHERSLKTSSSV